MSWRQEQDILTPHADGSMPIVTGGEQVKHSGGPVVCRTEPKVEEVATGPDEMLRALWALQQEGGAKRAAMMEAKGSVRR